MGKRQRSVSGVRYTHQEMITKRRETSKSSELSSFDFDTCCLTFLPLKDIYVDKYGYAYSVDAAKLYFQSHSSHPYLGEPMTVADLIHARFEANQSSEKVDPMTHKALSPREKIVLNRKNGIVYSYQTIKEFNIQANSMQDITTGDPFTLDDLVTIHDPDRQRSFPERPPLASDEMNQESAILSGAKAFVKAVGAPQCSSSEKFWFLAAPGGESLAKSSVYKFSPPSTLGRVQLDTSLGPVEIELDTDYAPLGCINFLGFCYRGAYLNSRVEFVKRESHAEFSSSSISDENVWGVPIPYEVDERRRGFKFPIFILNRGNPQIHITNTSLFGVACSPIQIDRSHIFGGVVRGQEAVGALCNGQIYPNGRPTKPFSINSIKILTNPFPASEN